MLRDTRSTTPMTIGEIARLVMTAVVLTAVLTHPTVAGFTTHGRFDTGDGRFSIWNVGWIDHAIVSEPARVFDANIFHPETGTLAYSEPNLIAGLLGLPVFAVTGSAIAALNGALLLGFVLAFICMGLLVRRVTGSEAGALVAATGFTFCPYVQAHTAHIQLILVFGFPLVAMAFVACQARPSPLRGAWLGAALACTGLTSGYYGIFAGLMAGLMTIGYARRDRQYWIALLVAGVVAAALVLPVLVPYRAIRADVGAGGGVLAHQARTYSATMATYLSSPSHAHGWMPAATESVFPGFVLIAGAGLGIAGMRRSDPGDRRTVAVFLGVAILAFWTSFGPDGGLYRALSAAVPFMDMLRAPARLGVVVTFALAVLAAFGARRVLDGRPVATALVMLVMAVELAAVPWPLRPEAPVPEAYQRLAALPRGPLVEYPFPYRRADFHEHTRAMIGSIHHWQPLVNGYSDVTPPAFEALALELAAFPDAASFEAMQRLGVRYVLWHLDRYNDEARARLLARFPPFERFLRTLSDDGAVRLVEIVAWPERELAR